MGQMILQYIPDLKGKQQERALKDKITSPVIICLHLL